jgi:DNA-binding YbaB/EbfC family protein
MKGFNGGMAQLMKQANQMQLKMKKVQEELNARTFEGTAGGGAVKVVAAGNSTIQSIAISDDAFKSGDKEMLQDLITVAANEALKTAKDTHSKEMEKITGGMNIPGLS